MSGCDVVYDRGIRRGATQVESRWFQPTETGRSKTITPQRRDAALMKRRRLSDCILLRIQQIPTRPKHQNIGCFRHDRLAPNPVGSELQTSWTADNRYPDRYEHFRTDTTAKLAPSFRNALTRNDASVDGNSAALFPLLFEARLNDIVDALA